MQVNLTEGSRAHPRNSPVPIIFTEDEGKRLNHPHFDALVVDLEIEKHKVMRNLIDNGSSVDIIFARALDQLSFPEKTLRLVKNNLRGFASNEVVPMGRIALRVTFGTIQGVASTYHLLLKFPTPYIIGVSEGIRTLSRETYQVATSFRSK